MKLLNIYGQYDHHTEAKIIGNREGLEALKAVIEEALKGIGALENGSVKASSNAARGHVNADGKVSGKIDDIFASDGEGYEVIVEMNNTHWGMDALGNYDRKAFWNSAANEPQYLMWELIKSRNEGFERKS